jgi:hypothetical protein
MSDIFATDTSTDALKAYLSTNSLETFDDALEMFRIGGATNGAGDEALPTCLLNMTRMVQNDIVKVSETKAGRKAADAVESPVEKLMQSWIIGSGSKVVKGDKGSYRNMLTSFNKVARYAKLSKATDQIETMEKALSLGRDRRNSGEKVRRGADILYSVAGTALGRDRIKNATPLTPEEIALCVKSESAERKAFDERVRATLKNWREDKKSEAPKDSADWDNVIDALTTYIESIDAKTEADNAVANFATGTVGALKTAGVGVKLNKTSLTIDMSGMTDEQRAAIAKVMGVVA